MSEEGWIEVTNKKPKSRKPQLPPSSINKHHPTANTVFKEQYNKLANYINHDKTRETEIYSIHFQKNMNIHYDYYLNFGEKVCKNSCCLPVNTLTPGNKYVQPKIIVEKDKKKISSIIGLIFHLPTEEEKQKTIQLLELQLKALQKSNDALGCFSDDEEAPEGNDAEKVKREKVPCNITEKREGRLKGMRHLLFVSLRQYIENQAADISLPCDPSNTHSVKFGKRENALKRFKVFEKYIHSFEEEEEDDEEDKEKDNNNNNNNNNNNENSEEKKEKVKSKLDEYYLLFGLDTPIEFIDEKTGKKQEYKESNLSLPGGSSFEHPRETCVRRLEEETGISPKLLNFLHPPISFISFTFNRPMYFYFFEVELKGKEEKEDN